MINFTAIDDQRLETPVLRRFVGDLGFCQQKCSALGACKALNFV